MRLPPTTTLLPLALLVACAAPETAAEGAAEPPPTAPAADLEPLNDRCPRSGEPVAASSLTEYRGYVVGFCNTHCRDDFAANVDERPRDREAFDRWIAAVEAAGR